MEEDYDSVKLNEFGLDSNEIFTKNILTNMTFSEHILDQNLKDNKYNKSIGYMLQCDKSNSCFGQDELMAGCWIPHMDIPEHQKENGWFIPSKHLEERRNLDSKSKKYDIKTYMALDPIVKELQGLGAVYLLSAESYTLCHPDLITAGCRPVVHCDYQLNKKQITDMLLENKELKTVYFTFIRECAVVKGKMSEVNEKINYKIVMFFLLFLMMNYIHIYYIQDAYDK